MKEDSLKHKTRTNGRILACQRGMTKDFGRYVSFSEAAAIWMSRRLKVIGE